MNRRLITAAVVAAVLVAVLMFCIGSYNRLVALNQDVESQWGQVENVYQRRADTIPNLVETVKGAAAHERETLEAVVQARAKATQTQITPPYEDPAAMAKFQASQDELSSALSRLLVVVEQYPQLKANENFLALQSQLEGTENRIAVERMRFNETAKAFNTKRESFPTMMIAGMFGDKFASKTYFKAQAGAEVAPRVEF